MRRRMSLRRDRNDSRDVLTLEGDASPSESSRRATIISIEISTIFRQSYSQALRRTR